MFRHTLVRSYGMYIWKLWMLWVRIIGLFSMSTYIFLVTYSRALSSTASTCTDLEDAHFWIELMINKFHGLSPSGGLVSPSGGFASLLFDQVGYFASIKLCQALSRQGAIIKIPVVRCHYLLCSSAQLGTARVISYYWVLNSAIAAHAKECGNE